MLIVGYIFILCQWFGFSPSCHAVVVVFWGLYTALLSILSVLLALFLVSLAAIKYLKICVRVSQNCLQAKELQYQHSGRVHPVLLTYSISNHQFIPVYSKAAASFSVILEI